MAQNKPIMGVCRGIQIINATLGGTLYQDLPVQNTAPNAHVHSQKVGYPEGGHNIDSDTVSKRFDKRFEDLLEVLPYCNEATFYDNNNGFVTVAKYKNGEIQPIGESPNWLKELMEKLN